MIKPQSKSSQVFGSKLEKEKVVPAAKAFELAYGHRPHLKTLVRWIKEGCEGVQLEALLLGSRWCTSREAAVRFVQARTAARLGVENVSATESRSEAEKDRELEDALS